MYLQTVKHDSYEPFITKYLDWWMDRYLTQRKGSQTHFALVLVILTEQSKATFRLTLKFSIHAKHKQSITQTLKKHYLTSSLAKNQATIMSD